MLPSYVSARLKTIRGLEPSIEYSAYFYNPRSGATLDIGPVQSEAGQWMPKKIPDYLDWVIVLETKNARVKRQA
jgi:hypothetical protein